MKRIIYTVAAAAAVLTGSVAAAAPALASNGPSTFTTHANQNPDTTSLSGGPGVTLSSGQGPVWAWDNLTIKLTPVPQAQLLPDGANYVVNVQVVGSFHGFADPLSGAPLTSDGPVNGTISYDVYSRQGPNGANLPAQEPGWTVDLNANPQVFGGKGLGDAIVQLMGPGSSIVGGGNIYNFSYQNGNYTQVATPTLTINGDVRGH